MCWWCGYLRRREICHQGAKDDLGWDWGVKSTPRTQRNVKYSRLDEPFQFCCHVALRISTFFIKRCSIHHTHTLGFPFHNARGCRGSRFKFQFQLTFYLSFGLAFETWLHRHEPICCNLQSQWLTGANEENRKRKAQLNAVGIFLCWPKFI